MYVAVPCYNLRRMHRAVAHDMPKPRTLISAWREMRSTWRRQADDAGYEFDTPVPEPALRHNAPDPLEASMGGLAPAALAERS